MVAEGQAGGREWRTWARSRASCRVSGGAGRRGPWAGRGGQPGRGGALPAHFGALPAPSLFRLLPAPVMPMPACLRCSSSTAEPCMRSPHRALLPLHHPPRQNATPYPPTHPPTHRLLPHPPTACSPTHPPTHPACLPASLPAGHMHFLHRLVNGVHNSDQCIDLQALRKCLSCANNLYAHMIQ